MRAKFEILGCGTSTGVPVPGCDCSVCTSTDPKNQRLRSSAVLHLDDQRKILIDAGPDLRQQVLRSNITDLEAVIYTHEHADHVLGIDDLRVFNFRRDTPIDCYGSKDTLSAIQDLFPYIFRPTRKHLGGMVSRLQLHPREYYRPFQVSGIEVRLLPVGHGNVTTSALHFGQFAYVTDCHDFPAETLEALAGVPLLFIDGIRDRPHRTHLTVQEACDVAQQLGAQQTYLIHMTHELDYSELEARLPQGVNAAYDGLQVAVELDERPLE